METMDSASNITNDFQFNAFLKTLNNNFDIEVLKNATKKLRRFDLSFNDGVRAFYMTKLISTLINTHCDKELEDLLIDCRFDLYDIVTDCFFEDVSGDQFLDFFTNNLECIDFILDGWEENISRDKSIAYLNFFKWATIEKKQLERAEEIYNDFINRKREF